MKVLSVKNPWAYLIIYHGKDIENRVRKTNYRGRIAIHCSQKSDTTAWDILWCNKEIKKIFEELHKNRAEIEKLNGKIIVTVELYNCTYPALTVAVNPSPWAEMESPWHYWLKDPVSIAEPIPVRGMLGLWDYSGL
jgi:hypothetical protein